MITREEFIKTLHEAMGPGDTAKLIDEIVEIYNEAGNGLSDTTHNEVIYKIAETLGLED